MKVPVGTVEKEAVGKRPTALPLCDTISNFEILAAR